MAGEIGAGFRREGARAYERPAARRTSVPAARVRKSALFTQKGLRTQKKGHCHGSSRPTQGAAGPLRHKGLRAPLRARFVTSQCNCGEDAVPATTPRGPAAAQTMARTPQ